MTNAVKDGVEKEEKPPIRTEGAMAPLFHAISEKRKIAFHFHVNEWGLKVELMELSKKTSFEHFTRLISMGVDCVGRSAGPESMYKMFNTLIDCGATAEQVALVEGFAKRIIPKLEHDFEEITGVGEGGDSKFFVNYQPEWAFKAVGDAAKRLPMDRLLESLALGVKALEHDARIENVLEPLSLNGARLSNAEFSKLLSLGNELVDKGIDPSPAICTLSAIRMRHGEKKFFEMSDLLKDTMLELRKRGVDDKKVASIPEVADNWALNSFKNNLEFMGERAREIGQGKVTIGQIKEVSRLIGGMGDEEYKLWLARLVELGDSAYSVAPYLRSITKFIRNEEDWKTFELAFKMDLSKYRRQDLDSVFMKILTDPEKDVIDRIKNALSYLEEGVKDRMEKYGVDTTYFEPDDTMAADLLVRSGLIKDKHVRGAVEALSRGERIQSASHVELASDAKGVKDWNEPGMKFDVAYYANEYGVTFAGRIKAELSRGVCNICKGEVSKDEFAGKGMKKAAAVALDPAILNFKLIEEDSWVGNMDGVICKNRVGENAFLLSSVNFNSEHRVSKLDEGDANRFAAKCLENTIRYFGMCGYDHLLIPADVSERESILSSMNRVAEVVGELKEIEVRKAGSLKHLDEIGESKESFRQLGEIREGEWVKLSCYVVKLDKEKYESINEAMGAFKDADESKQLKVYDVLKGEIEAVLGDKKKQLKNEINDAILTGSVALPHKATFVFMYYDTVFDEFRQIVDGSVSLQTAKRIVVNYLRDLKDSCEKDYKDLIKNSNEAVERVVKLGIVKTDAGYEVDRRTLAHELANIFGSAYQGGGHVTEMPHDKSFVPDQMMRLLYPFLPDFVTAAFSKEKMLLHDKDVRELVFTIRDIYLKQRYFTEEVKRHAGECIDKDVTLTKSMFYSIVEDRIREDEGFRRKVWGAIIED